MGAQMNNPDQNSYYQARIEAERQAAVAAKCPQAKRAHEELALAYEELIDRMIHGIAAAPIRSSKIR
jgi:hypothetical protein